MTSTTDSKWPKDMKTDAFANNSNPFALFENTPYASRLRPYFPENPPTTSAPPNLTSSTAVPPSVPTNSTTSIPWALRDTNGQPLTDAQLATKLYLYVDAFHVNIGTGDCTVYYLVEHPQVSGEKPFIHRAVIIDGGKTTGVGALRKFLEEYVQIKFSFDTTQGGRVGLRHPPFDAMVITHWDQDHFEGLLALVKKHAELDQTSIMPTPLEYYLSPYFKYQPDIPPSSTSSSSSSSPVASATQSLTPRARRSQTYMYMPYWGLAPRGKKNLTYKFNIAGDKYPDIGRTDPVKPSKSSSSAQDTDLTAEETAPGPGIFEGQGFLDWMILVKAKRPVIPELCRYRAGSRYIIGASLFNNRRIPFAIAQAMINPRDLATWHHKLMQGAEPTTKIPFLCIVASMVSCCGETKSGESIADAVNRLITQYAPKFGIPVDDDTLLEDEYNPERLEEAEEEIKFYFGDKHVLLDKIPLKDYDPDPHAPASDAADPDILAEDDEAPDFPWKRPSTVPTTSNQPVPTNLSATSSTVHAHAIIRSSQNTSSPQKVENGDQQVAPQSVFISPLSTSKDSTTSLASGPVWNPPFRHTGIKVVDENLPDNKSAQSGHDNAISVISLVVWTDGQLSQYTAGDSWWMNEMKVVGWISAGKNPYQSVHSVKLSHHGANSSNPVELIRHFRPRNIVVSAGDEYGHPRPETILWLYLWYTSTQQYRYIPALTGVTPRHGGILCGTGFPYYLIWDGDSINGAFVEMQEIQTKHAVWQQDYDEWLKKNKLKPGDKMPKLKKGQEGPPRKPTILNLDVFKKWPLYNDTKINPKTRVPPKPEDKYRNSLYRMLDNYKRSLPGMPFPNYYQDLMMRGIATATDDDEDVLPDFDARTLLTDADWARIEYVFAQVQLAWQTMSKQTYNLSHPSNREYVDRGQAYSLAANTKQLFVWICLRPKEQATRELLDDVMDGYNVVVDDSMTFEQAHGSGKTKANANDLPKTGQSFAENEVVLPLPDFRQQFSSIFTSGVYKTQPTTGLSTAVVDNSPTSKPPETPPGKISPDDMVADVPAAPARITLSTTTPLNVSINAQPAFDFYANGGALPGNPVVMPPPSSGHGMTGIPTVQRGLKRKASDTDDATNKKPAFSDFPNVPHNVSHAAVAVASTQPIAGQTTTVPNGTQPPTVVFTDLTDLVPGSINTVWDASGRKAPVVILKEDDFSAFIRCLHYPFLTVGTTSALVPGDNFRMALLGFMHQDVSTAIAVQIQVNKLGDVTQPDLCSIKGMSVTLPGADRFPRIAFSTRPEHVGINFGGSARSTTAIVAPDTGIFLYHMFLCLGFDKGTSSTDLWKIGQVLDFAGILSESAGAAFAAFSAVLGDRGIFTLKKGMIWCLPLEHNRIVQRMEWMLDTTVQEKVASFIREWVSDKLAVSNMTLVARKDGAQPFQSSKGKGYSIHAEIELILAFDLKIGSIDKTVSTYLDFDIKYGGITTTLTFIFDGIGPGSHGATLNDMFAWLETLLVTESISDCLDWFPGINTAGVKRVELRSAKGRLDRISLDIEFIPGWKDADKNPITFLLQYTWIRGLLHPHSFLGKVWLSAPEATWLAPQIMPGYEEYRVLRPSKPVASRLHLGSFMAGLPSLPAELDLSICNAEIRIDGPSVSLTGTLVAASSSTASHIGIDLATVTLSASYSWDADQNGGKAPAQRSYAVELDASIVLPDLADADVTSDSYRPTTIQASISLVSLGTDKFFRLGGSVSNLCLSQISRFFPDDDRPMVEDILGHITLKNLAVQYDYSATSGNGSQFYVNADIVLGPAELLLSFYRSATPDTWAFAAELVAAEGVDAKLGSILKEILGSDAADIVDSMPDFVTAIELGKGNAGIKLDVTSTKPPAKLPNDTASKPPQSGSFVVSLNFYLPGPAGTDFELSLIQITEKPGADSLTTVPNSSLQGRTKRIVVATIGDLPWHLIPRPPVVDQMVPAFDSLGFYWVQDPAAIPDQNGNVGLTLAEMAIINDVVPFSVAFKAPQGSAPDTTVVLTSGMHFVCLDAGGVAGAIPKMILDYPFNKPKTEKEAEESGAADGEKGNSQPISGIPKPAPSGTEDGGGKTAKGTLNKSKFGLKIQNVGLRLEDGELIIFLDLVANLGPIELELLGFGFGMPLKDLKLNELGKHVPSLHLQGMGVSFNEPPVSIAGMFVERKTDTMKVYIGGIALTIEPYSFMAVGEYGEVKKNFSDTDSLDVAISKGNTFKTVFIFAKLSGPLIELEIVTIGGITLGFGYNSRVVAPRVEDVPSFPFISNSGLGGSSDPLAVMTALADPVNGIIRPLEGSYWIALGLEGKLLEVLDLSAVVILEFNPYVSFGIYARASMSMPPETPREFCYLYVELGMSVNVNFREGQFRVEAQLTPNSFIYAQLCHLTGGFALCYWFGASEHAGDFVFSAGGYHPAYRPASWYPVPKRLAITWGVDDHLSIRGEAYFAITTKCCMGGGRLDAVFDVGLLSAYLSAHADFLIDFSPFYFTADLGISIGVEFTLELLFISIHISVHINASLHLQGPPFGGYVYVDFWVFGFTIPFGDLHPKTPPKTIEQLCTLLSSVPDPDAPTQEGSTTTVNKLHILSVESGRFTEKQKDAATHANALWVVKRGGFVFRVQSRIPISQVSEPAFPKQQSSTISDTAQFYSVPVQLTKPLVSTMEVSVQKVHKNDASENEPFRIESPVKKALPLSLWGAFDSNHPTGNGNNNIESLLDTSGGTTSLMVGASFKAPLPIISPDLIKPFNVVEASALDVFSEGMVKPSLSDSVTFCSTNWASADPSAISIKIEQGTDNRRIPWIKSCESWNHPTTSIEEIANSTSLVDAGDAAAADDITKDDQAVVLDMINLWVDAFAWDKRPDGNVLTNEVTTKGGNEPLIWKNFESLYMAAPLVGVA